MKYCVEVWTDGIVIEADSSEEAAEKAKAIIFREGLALSVELCGDEDASEETAEESDYSFVWDIGREFPGTLNSLN
jgi:hypothetical protein